MAKIIKKVKKSSEPVTLSGKIGSLAGIQNKTDDNPNFTKLDFHKTITSEINNINSSLNRKLSRQSNIQDQKEKDLSQKAYDDGYQAGFDAAIEKERSERIKSVDKLMKEAKKKSDEAIHGLQLKVIDIAIFIAEQIIRKSITKSPEIIEDIIQDTLSYLIGNEKIVLKVSEKEFDVINANYDKWLDKVGNTQEFRLEIDKRLKTGDCIIETEGGVIDAVVSHRLDTIAEELLKASS
ncbi:FliH/SctL family protein [Candidatus Latescibacterota bacterium]